MDDCSKFKNKILIVIGGGLSGCEAAWQAAERGIHVKLFEMRPKRNTEAHITSNLAELVCSNSFGSKLPNRASGILKEELRFLNSLLLNCAETTALPAGSALAVDRQAFSELVTQRIQTHPNIEVIREEVSSLPLTPAIVASGPLTPEALSLSIEGITEHKGLYFYDAVAPIISLDSIDERYTFRGSRYSCGEQSEGDYINCPLSKDQYYIFVNSLQNAKRKPIREFETSIHQGVNAGHRMYFESCLPIEVIAERSKDALSFGPLRPIGLIDPRTGKRPFAVIQLRQDNLAGSLYNIVGFQTNLLYSEQKRIFSLIPGLENAEFIRFGQMHRNSFIASPILLDPTLQLRNNSNIFFAGQITGIEGYMGNIATGLLAGINSSQLLHDNLLIELPQTTMIGALIYYITHAESTTFQPMKANIGILPPVNSSQPGKRAYATECAKRAQGDLEEFIKNHPHIKVDSLSND